MKTFVRFVEALPDSAQHVYDEEASEIELVWLRVQAGFLRVEKVPDAAASFHGATQKTPQDFIQANGGVVESLPVSGAVSILTDSYHKSHSPIFQYWITTPDTQLSGVQDFVAAAEAGGLPASWSETPAEDAGGAAYTLCSFRLTMDGARSLGAEQSALMALADLPADVFFFQTVAPIEGFTGVEKESRQPTTLESQLYEPGTLFQTSHPDAAGQRGGAFGEADVLEVTGLSLT